MILRPGQGLGAAASKRLGFGFGPNGYVLSGRYETIERYSEITILLGLDSEIISLFICNSGITKEIEKYSEMAKGVDYDSKITRQLDVNSYFE